MLSEGWRWPLPIFQFCRYCVHALTDRKHGSAFWPRTWPTPLAAPGGVTTVSLARTDGGHIEGVGLSQSPFQNGNSRTFEVRPAGNAVKRDDEGGRQPDGFSDGDRALHAKPESHQDRAWQTLNTDRVEGNVGSFEDADHRSFGPARSGGPHAHHFRKHCQCGLNTSTRKFSMSPAMRSLHSSSCLAP